LGHATIVGRGVLIDYFEYRKHSYNPLTKHHISVADIEDCARIQNVDFKYGDILIIRTGFTWKYNQLSPRERQDLANTPPFEISLAGVGQTEEMLDFLHDHYFSIVAGDAPGFEAVPQPEYPNFHLILIPLWGMCMGEMFDLEKLSQTCKRLGRYEFFFCSSPPHIPGTYQRRQIENENPHIALGAIGSYSHALAMF
jgi:hypothetical protein